MHVYQPLWPTRRSTFLFMPCSLPLCVRTNTCLGDLMNCVHAYGAYDCIPGDQVGLLAMGVHGFSIVQPISNSHQLVMRPSCPSNAL